MRVIVLATIKGGVGKTMLAAHLAAALAAEGKRTLLVDLDPQGHATLLAGVDMAPDAPCMGDVLVAKGDGLRSVIVGDENRLAVAPAVLRMAMQERQLYAEALRFRVLARALDAARDFEAVVVDTPPHIGAFTEAALHAADLTIAPMPCLAGALQGFADLEQTWTELQDGRAGTLAAVINLFDRRTRATNLAVMAELATLGAPVFRTRIPRAEAINQAGLDHGLLFDTQPAHPAAAVLREFAVEAWAMVGGNR